MLNLRRRSRAASVYLLLCAASGCGRMVLGRLPTPIMPQVCTVGGWCWTHPLPSSDRLVQAFSVGADDLWFIGASGTIVRFAGGAWSAIPSPMDGLSTIWASASDDVWVGGPAGPFRWNSDAWMIVAPPTSGDSRAVGAIWGCAPTDVWAMGSVATHWDGRTLSYFDMPLFERGFGTVWGTACDNIWGGYLDGSLGSGRIEHYNGTKWTMTESRPAEQIVGTGADDIWSLAQGQLYQWSGLGPATLRDSHTVSLFPVGASAVGTLNDSHRVSVFARSGTTSSLPVPAPDPVNALWGRSASDLWGFGARGVATHWDGSAWTAHLPGWALSGGDAVRVTGSGPSDLWAVVGDTLLHGDGSTWQTALTSQEVGGSITGVWASAPDDVWVLGGDALIHHFNGSWSTKDPAPDATAAVMHGISGTGPTDVWVLRGRNSVLHWDGTVWIGRQPLQVDNLVGIWAPAPNEVWVVGDGLAHFRGTGWETPPRIPSAIGRTPFTAVGGSGPTDVWILAGGYALKVSDDYRDLTVILNSDGHAASLTPAATGGVWTIVQNGTAASRIYHLAGTTFGDPLLAPAGLNDLWAAADGTLWAAGSGGALIRKRPAAAP